MIKKLLALFIASFALFACTTLQENYNMVNCKYELLSVDPVDFNFNSISMNIVLGIQNLNKTTAASLKKFEGTLVVNDDNDIATMTLKDIRIEPGEAKAVKSTLEVPLANLGKGLSGLISMGSVSVEYKIKGTMYFTTPIGDIPYPVTIYQSKK